MADYIPKNKEDSILWEARKSVIVSYLKLIEKDITEYDTDELREMEIFLYPFLHT